MFHQPTSQRSSIVSNSGGGGSGGGGGGSCSDNSAGVIVESVLHMNVVNPQPLRTSTSTLVQPPSNLFVSYTVVVTRCNARCTLPSPVAGIRAYV